MVGSGRRLYVYGVIPVYGATVYTLFLRSGPCSSVTCQPSISPHSSGSVSHPLRSGRSGRGFPCPSIGPFGLECLSFMRGRASASDDKCLVRVLQEEYMLMMKRRTRVAGLTSKLCQKLHSVLAITDTILLTGGWDPQDVIECAKDHS
jgi:hypothetical protein